MEWVQAGDDPGADWMAPLGLLGVHSRRNALIARACLRALGVPAGGRRRRRWPRAAAGFDPLAHRLQVIGEVGGVTFVDDSLSTNVLPTLAALDAFPGRRVALIAGGHDRGIDYAPLAAGLAARTRPPWCWPCPTAAPGSRPRSRRRSPRKVDVVACDGLAPAVERGLRAGPARTGSCCCRPPRRASAAFRDYRDRGEAFARAMHACGG